MLPAVSVRGCVLVCSVWGWGTALCAEPAAQHVKGVQAPLEPWLHSLLSPAVVSRQSGGFSVDFLVYMRFPCVYEGQEGTGCTAARPHCLMSSLLLPSHPIDILRACR